MYAFMDVLILVLFAFVIGVMALRAGRELWQALRVRRWPTTTGRVLAAEVREVSAGAKRRSAAAGTRYAPQVLYEYGVKGAFYRSERIQLGQIGAGVEPDGARQVIARYPLGSRVTVYYNPDNPSEATLERSIGRSTLIWWLVTLLVLAVAAAIWLF